MSVCDSTGIRHYSKISLDIIRSEGTCGSSPVDEEIGEEMKSTSSEEIEATTRPSNDIDAVVSQTVKGEYEAIGAAMNSHRNEEHKDEEEEVTASWTDISDSNTLSILRIYYSDYRQMTVNRMRHWTVSWIRFTFWRNEWAASKGPALEIPSTLSIGPSPFPLGETRVESEWHMVVAFVKWVYLNRMPHKAVALQIILGVFPVVTPIIVTHITDTIFPVGVTSPPDGYITKVAVLSAIYVVIFFIQARVKYIFEFELPEASVRRDFRNMMHHELLQMSGHQAERWNTGQALFCLHNEVETMVDNIWGGFFKIISFIISFLSFVLLSGLHFKLTWFFLAIVLISFIFVAGPFLIYYLYRYPIFRLAKQHIHTTQRYGGIAALHLSEARVGLTDSLHGRALRGEILSKRQREFEECTHVDFLAFFQSFFFQLNAFQLHAILGHITFALAIVLIAWAAGQPPGTMMDVSGISRVALVSYAITSCMTLMPLAGQMMTTLEEIATGHEALLQVAHVLNHDEEEDRDNRSALDVAKC